MENKTKKGIMLGALLLGCGLTSLLGGLVGNNTEKKIVKNFSGSSQLGLEKTAIKDKTSQNQAKLIKIYVSGAVFKPGLYDIPVGSRADDAITLAGGMTEAADVHRVNLAKKLKDGMQVYVPFAKRKASSKSTSKKTNTSQAVISAPRKASKQSKK